jgi:hypothetical protein
MTPIAPDTVDELELPSLTALDRCDSCGAQAYVRVTLASGELLFCAHHAAEFKDKLQPQALAWHDETARLLETAAE